MRSATPHRANRVITPFRSTRSGGVLFPTRSRVNPTLTMWALGFSYQTDYAVIMAGGVIASIPVLIIFFIAQRYVIEGIARSGIKG